ncbi:MAG: hypothetical protein IKL53_12335 [Lachnospiraceae bacterium]|nr:hypothetical protein [Lachnospiraceae bacterium]
MSYQVVELNCPGCGARISTGQTVCEWCHRPVLVSTFNSINDMPAPTLTDMNANKIDNVELSESKVAAIKYLKLKKYDKAVECFDKAIEENFDDSEVYFYAAICCLQGKKAFVASRNVINQILEYINAAIAIEPKGIYYYFEAYIKYDYFHRKHFRITPDYTECIEMAKNAGVSEYDINELYSILNVERLLEI